ncbi:MAG: hypothetical protein ACK4Q4_03725 [Rhodocyclaceae bacterium]
MPTLNWIGKEAVVKHHEDVPFRLLEPVPELSCGDADSGNLIVQTDNLSPLQWHPQGRSVAGGNVLTGPAFAALPPFVGPKVIYAAACRLGSAWLAREGIAFKQTPYALEI